MRRLPTSLAPARCRAPPPPPTHTDGQTIRLCGKTWAPEGQWLNEVGASAAKPAGGDVAWGPW